MYSQNPGQYPSKGVHSGRAVSLKGGSPDYKRPQHHGGGKSWPATPTTVGQHTSADTSPVMMGVPGGDNSNLLLDMSVAERTIAAEMAASWVNQDGSSANDPNALFPYTTPDTTPVNYGGDRSYHGYGMPAGYPDHMGPPGGFPTGGGPGAGGSNNSAATIALLAQQLASLTNGSNSAGGNAGPPGAPPLPQYLQNAGVGGGPGGPNPGADEQAALLAQALQQYNTVDHAWDNQFPQNHAPKGKFSSAVGKGGKMHKGDYAGGPGSPSAWANQQYGGPGGGDYGSWQQRAGKGGHWQDQSKGGNYNWQQGKGDYNAWQQGPGVNKGGYNSKQNKGFGKEWGGKKGQLHQGKGGKMDGVHQMTPTELGLPEGCSQALMDFRIRGMKKELNEILPHVVEFCKDQYGSRYIQQKLQVSAAHEKQAFYLALKPHVRDLVLDPFGNYVVQKFFERGNREHREGLASELRGLALGLSYHMFGCWVMQRLMEVLDTNPDLQKELAEELQADLLGLIVNQNGNHVVQACVENMPAENTTFIVHTLQGSVVRMARHTYGCRVLQRIVERCQTADVEPIIEELLPELDDLMRDEYGNYVVQSIAERIGAPRRPQVVDYVCANLTKLATNKYASNVCEKIMMYSSEDDANRMTNIILGEETEPEPPVLTMMRHRYANYCVQKMLEKMSVESPFVDRVRTLLRVYVPQIRTFVYGRHILQSLFRLGVINAEELQQALDASPAAQNIQGVQHTSAGHQVMGQHATKQDTHPHRTTGKTPRSTPREQQGQA
ncbi:unnamed protein product [Amoebophrya sp. A120]|nr:unnamed protein product [Amoebophrya sp. A120]|eukprot:GSA120T00011752001.1